MTEAENAIMINHLPQSVTSSSPHSLSASSTPAENANPREALASSEATIRTLTTEQPSRPAYSSLKNLRL